MSRRVFLLFAIFHVNTKKTKKSNKRERFYKSFEHEKARRQCVSKTSFFHFNNRILNVDFCEFQYKRCSVYYCVVLGKYRKVFVNSRNFTAVIYFNNNSSQKWIFNKSFVQYCNILSSPEHQTVCFSLRNLFRPLFGHYQVKIKTTSSVFQKS